MKKYRWVFITHLPSFYKTNLYDELSAYGPVLAIFLGNGSSIRQKSFAKETTKVDTICLSDGSFEERNKFSCCKKLYKILKSIEYSEVVLGGWDQPEFYLVALISSKSKNSLALESSIYESSTNGLQSVIKRAFLSRISTIYASGQPHKQLVEQLKATARIVITHGVGLSYSTKWQNERIFKGRFLFVGRLATEKNIELLLQAFNKLPQFELTIIGNGSLNIQEKLSSNINWITQLEHHELAKQYQQHDVLILPSIREPWGLVVEEALINTMPVIVSDRVGARVDFVEKYNAGKVFSSDNIQLLIKCINEIAQQDEYAQFVKNCASIPFDEIRKNQIAAYL